MLDMRKRQYTVVFEPQPEGGYTITVPALPGCISEGDTLEEARRMAADAIKGYCECLLKDGLPIPGDTRRPPRLEKVAVTITGH